MDLNDRASLLAADQTLVCLLGLPIVARAGRPPHTLERKDAALLAMLALDGPMPRARAAGLLWPDATPQVARGNLRQRLFRLRAALGRDLVQAATTLRLLDDLSLDIAELHDRLQDDPHAGTGELLASHDYADAGELGHWVDGARERWRSTRLNLLTQVAGGHEARREVERALPYVQRMLADDPLLEHAHRRLMRLHYLRGDRAAALAAYDTCRRILGEQLGLRASPETVELARLIESSGALAQAAVAPRPVATLRPPRMVGRDAEWQRLERCLRAGGAAQVEGDAGIGKSRLLGELAAALGAGRAVICGARSGDARLPHALAGRIVQALVQHYGAPRTAWACADLAHVAPLLGAAAVPAPTPLRLQQALVEALKGWCAQGLALLAIDDLHFADSATLHALPALRATLRDAAVPCLLATRPAESPVRDSDDDTLERVALGPLDADGVRALLDSLALPGLDAAAWAPALTRHTGGNPLFILETMIALLDGDAPLRVVPDTLPAPANIGALVERRLAQLSTGALKLARLAAVAGAQFDVELASRVLGVHALDIADHWRELEAAQVIRDAAFAHDLVREATLRSVPAAIARHLHEAVAQHLQAHDGAAATIAPHWEAAARWAEAAAAYEGAACAAQAASRHADEATLWAHAVACHEQHGARAAAFRARCASFKAVLAARPLGEADALAKRLLADAGDEQQRLDALLTHTLLQLVQHRGEAAHQSAIEALALAQRLGRPWQEFDAARALATALAQRKRGAEGAALLAGYEARVEAAGTPRQRYDYWADLAYVLNDAYRRQSAAHAYRKAVDLAVALGDRHELVTATSNLAILAAYLGQPQLAYESAERAQRIQAELGHTDDVVAGAAAMNLASFGLLLGHFDEALAQFEAASACFGRAAPAWAAGCEHNLASAWLQLGQTARARQTLCALHPDVPPTTRARRAIVEGRIERALHRSALPRLSAAYEALGEGGDAVQRALAQIDESRELQPAAAAALCRQVFERAESVELFGVASKALLYEIEATLRGGDVARLNVLAEAARERFSTRRPIDCYWGEVLWLQYQASATVGDAAAAGLLQDAARWVREVALPRVPEPFRDGFLHRQPVNRALLTLADRLARAAPSA